MKAIVPDHLLHIMAQWVERRRAMPLYIKVVILVAAVVGGLLSPSPTCAAPLGWRLVWSDDFDSLDDEEWRRTTSFEPTDNSQHAYLPEQVSVSNGKLVILSEHEPAKGLPYRSGQVISQRAQRFGRWEVRAQIPATRGMWPAIRLLPDAVQPSRYKVDIMVNRGDQPTITRSACHWGDRLPSSHGHIIVEQQTSLAGKLVSYPDDFHTYAVEWLEGQLRFYVDDVHHSTLYPDEAGDFFSRQMAPMQLVINTAIGGDSLPLPNASTVWPQRFLVDWVRVYEQSEAAADQAFSNGSFEAGNGALAGWHVFGNRVTGDPNVLVHNEAALEGKASLKLFGQSSGGANYSGASHGISVSAGERVRAKLSVLVRSRDSLAKTNNRAAMKLEFYNQFGDYFGGPAMLGVEERVIADGSTPNDKWSTQELMASAPDGAVEARLSIVFAQTDNEPGAVHIDAVEFARIVE